MAAKILPDAEALRKLFTYDPETGEIRYTARSADLYAKKRGFAIFNGRKLAGEIATFIQLGRLGVGINNQTYLAHRIAWKMFYGAEPPPIIDHINGDGRDNRIANLRAATHSQNISNSKLRVDNSSGVKGVYLDRNTGFYSARLRVANRFLYLGYFPTIEEATKARQEAAIKYHGEFARF